MQGRAGFKGINRVLDQAFHWTVGIDQAVDKRAVGTVFQQTAYQVRQQIFMATDRCIDPDIGLVHLHHMVVERIPHTMQALKLEITV